MYRIVLDFLRGSGNWPCIKLISIIFSRVGATTSADFFGIFGVRQSSPVSCVTYKEFIQVIRSVNFINGKLSCM